MIDKNTKLYCSFSLNPGNNGCTFFNNAFEKKNINAIYKSFYSNNIERSICAVKVLNISGFAISMPFKVDTLKYVDEISKEVKNIGACNTVVNQNGYLIAYNTDYIAVKSYIENINCDMIYILGNGGFSKSVQYACKLINLKYEIIDRDNWYKINQLKNQLLFNATPININSIGNTIIDARPFAEDGKKIALRQSIEQFKIYTGIDYE